MTDHKRHGEPQASTQAHWAYLPENSFIWGMRALLWIRKHLGTWLLMLCLYPVVFCYWSTNGRARAASRQYLSHLQTHTGAVGHPIGWRDTLRHFFAFAETIMDKLLAISNDPVAIDKTRAVSLLDPAKQQRGAIIVTAHIGCLELCSVSAEHNPHIRKLNVLVHTAHAERFNRLLKQLQPHSAVELLQVSEFSASTAVMLADKIAQGEYIAIAGDRVPLGKGLTVEVPFLGSMAHFPAGPYVLAATLKCPLYMMVCVRSPYLSRHYRYTMHAECLAEQVVLPRATRQQALQAYAQQYAQWLQSQLHNAPLSWFNFFNFWQQGRAKHERVQGPTE